MTSPDKTLEARRRGRPAGGRLADARIGGGDDEQRALKLRAEELRLNAGRSQKEAARALGLSQQAYNDALSSDTVLRRRDLVTLAVFYGMPLGVAFPMFSDPLAPATETEEEGSAPSAEDCLDWMDRQAAAGLAA